ncbi:flagellar biosynthesis protein FlhF [Modicisalibacter xianhensis]|uniref:Flagellar biosynthesis protein FlhF n=1 Tax=Modicisalibacter xianhensis TaxID=442341 RepID=A0A1I3A2W5_9GAMM|nr:flagellar biosynthesis protein FlhF [Halomonas xianhensis]SFH44230.1 flagellar biosynthesis protein FlhF [Halomonas xianhensis]
MSVKRFVGINSREAMRQVRAALGDDALILSNRQVPEGVEILALADDEHGRMTAPTGVASPAVRSPSPSAGAWAGAQSSSEPEPPKVSDTVSVSQPGGQLPGDFAAFSERVLGEMQDLRALLASQMHTSSTPAGESLVDRLRQRLYAAGFGVRLAQELLETPPTELLTADESQAQAWLGRQLASRLSVLDDEDGLLDAGGVFALVGPTGIGKTTTTAKLAARYVMRHGARGVALVTTDSYRIGAHEQLRIYARLLGVEVHALEADAPLGNLLTRLTDKRLVIIDTVGMSQRDQRLAGQIAMLGDSQSGTECRPIRRLLLLNAASHGDTLEEVVETYQRASLAAGAPLYGAILTKVDEAPRLGAVLDIAIRHGLCLHYLSHGQQVPEDLSLAERDTLVQQALSVAGQSSFAIDMPIAPSPGQRIQALSRGLLGQGRTLAASLSVLRRQVSGFALLEEAWPMLGYPLEQQRARIPALLDIDRRVRHGQQEAMHHLLWGRTRPVNGTDWAMPALSLNAAGHAQAMPWLAHLQPAGESERLMWAEAELGPAWHLLPSCPGGLARDTLANLGMAWLAMAQANSRVMVASERHALADLSRDAEARTQLACRYRGRDARLALSRRAVALDDGERLHAWFGTLVESETGRPLGQRYWLAPQDETHEQCAIEAMVAQLIHDDLPLLTRRAWRLIGEASRTPLDPELQLLVASGLAAVASRLDQERNDWAMDVRTQVMAALGGRRTRSSTALLEGLMHMLTARDAFRLAGAQ